MKGGQYIDEEKDILPYLNHLFNITDYVSNNIKVNQHFFNGTWGNYHSDNGIDHALTGNPDIKTDYNGSLFDGHYGTELSEFVYEAYDFERPIYLYIWGSLVTFTFLVNILVVWVLLQRAMRSVTNLILVAIAISDSLTGLVTLPSYFIVYTTENRGVGDTEYYIDMSQNGYDIDMYGNQSYDYSLGLEHYTQPDVITDDRDGYILSKSLCRGFMISKFFLAKSFHTISIWLTLFLGIQRYVSVAYPFKTKFWFTTRNTGLICVTIFLLAPVLHVYHLVNEKAVEVFCVWELVEGSVGDAVYLWTTMLLRHTLPCAALLVTTILFVVHLKRNAFHDGSSTSSRVFSGKVARGDENRRISIIVIAIVVVFLIPEVPYAIYIAFLTVVRHTNADHLNDQKRNRAIHAGYEISVVISFQFNFYIYTFFNRRFRQQLKTLCPRICHHVRRQSVTSTVSTQLSSNSSNRKASGSTKIESSSNKQSEKTA